MDNKIKRLQPRCDWTFVARHVNDPFELQIAADRFKRGSLFPLTKEVCLEGKSLVPEPPKNLERGGVVLNSIQRGDRADDECVWIYSQLASQSCSVADREKLGRINHIGNYCGSVNRKMEG